MKEYIERDAIENAFIMLGYGKEELPRRMLQMIPAADVAPVRHAKWCWVTEDIYMCDNCGEMSHVKEVMGKPDWVFCPNCGAKMDG